MFFFTTFHKYYNNNAKVRMLEASKSLCNCSKVIKIDKYYSIRENEHIDSRVS